MHTTSNWPPVGLWCSDHKPLRQLFRQFSIQLTVAVFWFILSNFMLSELSSSSLCIQKSFLKELAPWFSLALNRDWWVSGFPDGLLALCESGHNTFLTAFIQDFHSLFFSKMIENGLTKTLPTSLSTCKWKPVTSQRHVAVQFFQTVPVSIIHCWYLSSAFKISFVCGGLADFFGEDEDTKHFSTHCVYCQNHSPHSAKGTHFPCFFFTTHSALHLALHIT